MSNINTEYPFICKHKSITIIVIGLWLQGMDSRVLLRFQPERLMKIYADVVPLADEAILGIHFARAT